MQITLTPLTYLIFNLHFYSRARKIIQDLELIFVHTYANFRIGSCEIHYLLKFIIITLLKYIYSLILLRKMLKDTSLNS